MESELPVAGTSRHVTLTTSAITIDSTANEVTVTISGEVDMADADRVGDLLAKAASDGRPIVSVDLSRLTFADSSAIKALLVGAKAADDRGAAFQLVNPHANMRRLLAVTGLADALTLIVEPEVLEGPSSL